MVFSESAFLTDDQKFKLHLLQKAKEQELRDIERRRRKFYYYINREDKWEIRAIYKAMTKPQKKAMREGFMSITNW